MKKPCLSALLFASCLCLSAPHASAATPTLTTLYTFNGTNGAYPFGNLTADASGNLYGITVGTPAYRFGTVFELTHATGTLTTLATFPDNQPQLIASITADANGNLYGTTSGNTSANPLGAHFGTFFEIAAGSHALTTLSTFNGTTGDQPYSVQVPDSTGILYGTAWFGGAKGYGAVYQVAAGTHSLSTLASLDYTCGYNPTGTLVNINGNIFGAASYGGANGYGAVFEIAAGTHALSNVANFTWATGANPMSGLVADARGNLYGTTTTGAASSVFEVAAGTHTVTPIVTFDSTNGNGTDRAGLIADANGNLFGTTYRTVFEVAAGTHALTTLATFDSATTGLTPSEVTLTADAHGNLFGATSDSVGTGQGTIFEISDSGFVVPEPASLALLALAAALALPSRRRR